MERFVDDMIAKSTAMCKGRKFIKYPTKWSLFNDATDNLQIDKMDSSIQFKGKNIIFVASFSDNAVTMSQFHMIVYLCECFASTVTVLLPYYSTGTMERVDIGDDGVVPTANTLALLFSGLPLVGRPVRVMTYDLHTLQNRFYVGGRALASLHTAIPLVHRLVRERNNGINAIAFPDEGAHKRFRNLFKGAGLGPDDVIICSKVRDGDKKVIKISDGRPEGKHVLIIDDQTKSGGTLIECAKAIIRMSSTTKVSAFVTHAICTDEFWSKFTPDETGDIPINKFKMFYTTDSIPGLKEAMELGIHRVLNWTKTAPDKTGNLITTPYDRDANISGDSIGKKITILPLAELILRDL